MRTSAPSLLECEKKNQICHARIPKVIRIVIPDVFFSLSLCPICPPSFRLHDPAGLHRAAAAPISALAPAERPAQAGAPPTAGPQQRHARPPPQLGQRQHAQLALRLHPRGPVCRRQHSPGGPLPGEQPTGGRHLEGLNLDGARAQLVSVGGGGNERCMCEACSSR